ncbi:Phage T7 exclusion protein [Microbacterium esteraromaticum]|uniref:Phage T7 exclusion protein n=1 Tax=Microbacterium esteraromaticum TaxID=57043 RepID=A0A1R4IYD6_9MICO|nr:P-loop NTPase fold protein [Microbacterium esteraromaticum]SJN24891.1 Phage T7 exclusion protein [Microbacterium esteraromaticum]
MGNSTEKKAKRARGVVDTPAAVDSLSIEPYVEGLSRFIADCQTPMTIAVQGDWGTGKTNMMLLAERELAPHGHFRLSDPPEDAPAVKATTPHGDPASPIYTIRFNTWQYSQFDMASRLIPSLLENIGAHLLLADPGRGKGDKRAAFLRSLVPVASTAGLSILKAGLGAVGLAPLGVIVNDVHSAYDVSRADRAVTAEDTAAVLMQVKGKFAEAVEELVTPDEADSKASPGRVVVFIDDLDRLEPRKAVELMEALKLFLDVEHCVFILAIDFAVVEQGVGAKYGAAMDRVKARSFFDKIIQVPFQMPTAAYQISGLLDELIKSTGLALKPEDTKTFLELIQLSVGSNPRSIKRLINTFMLLRDIAGIADRIKNGEGRIAEVRNSELFAVLCLQTAYPDAYLDILENGGEDSDLFKHYFLNLDSEDEAHQEAHQAEQATVEWEKKLAEVGIEATGHRFSQLAARIAGSSELRWV